MKAQQPQLRVLQACGSRNTPSTLSSRPGSSCAAAQSCRGPQPEGRGLPCSGSRLRKAACLEQKAQRAQGGCGGCSAPSCARLPVSAPHIRIWLCLCLRHCMAVPMVVRCPHDTGCASITNVHPAPSWQHWARSHFLRGWAIANLGPRRHSSARVAKGGLCGCRMGLRWCMGRARGREGRLLQQALPLQRALQQKLLPLSRPGSRRHRSRPDCFRALICDGAFAVHGSSCWAYKGPP